jgi:DNA-binding transcriptional ArsR family regulator
MNAALQIVAEPRRQEILALVWERELKVGEIVDAVDVSFSAVSQHLKVLRNAKLVRLRKEGREHFYRADKAALGPLAAYLEMLWAKRLAALRDLAEAEERRGRSRSE